MESISGNLQCVKWNLNVLEAGNLSSFLSFGGVSECHRAGFEQHCKCKLKVAHNIAHNSKLHIILHTLQYPHLGTEILHAKNAAKVPVSCHVTLASASLPWSDSLLWTLGRVDGRRDAWGKTKVIFVYPWGTASRSSGWEKKTAAYTWTDCSENISLEHGWLWRWTVMGGS